MMGCGETKSGSPMPSEITSSMVAAISKKRRMPDGGTLRMRSERRPARRADVSMVEVSMGAVGLGMARSYPARDPRGGDAVRMWKA